MQKFWTANDCVAFFRSVEKTLRRAGDFDGADRVRQQADAVEAHGIEMLDCEVPHKYVRATIYAI